MKIAIVNYGNTHSTSDNIPSPALGRLAVAWPRPCATLSGSSSRSEL